MYFLQNKRDILKIPPVNHRNYFRSSIKRNFAHLHDDLKYFVPV